MDWDDSFDDWHDEWDSGLNGGSRRTDKSNPEEPFDPMSISNPVSAYFFLSDDAQAEVLGKDKKKMKCLDCGHQFKGEIYDRCPECFGSVREEVVLEEDESQW